MREIPLSKGHAALVDAADYEWLNGWRWYAKFGGATGAKPYAVRGVYHDTRGNRHVCMHREIIGAVAGQLVDHINGNSLDNRRSNIRLCTPGQNSRNALKRRHGASRFKGVGFCRRRGNWEVSVCCDRRRYYVGNFSDEIEAALAYDKAAKQYHGEFARLNFRDAKEVSDVPHATQLSDGEGSCIAQTKAHFLTIPRGQNL